MDKKGIVTAFLLAAGLLGTPNVQAQRTYEEMEQLTVRTIADALKTRKC